MYRNITMPPKFTRKPRAPRKKKVARAKRARANNTDIVHQIIKMSGAVNPTQGTNVSNYVYWMNSVSPYLSGSQSVSQSLSSSTEFALYKQMYDQFRVHSVNIRVVPRYKTTEQVALNLTEATLTMGKNVFYSVIDRDGIAPSSIPALKRYSSIKVHKNDKPMSRTYVVKYEGANGWFDCQQPQMQNAIQSNLGLDGGITFYGESFMENLNEEVNGIWADMEITYKVSFRGKSLISLKVGEEGQVTVSQTPVGTLELPQVLLTNDDVDHFGAIDLTGNTILT